MSKRLKILGNRFKISFKINQKALLIEDLATDGGSKVLFVEAMRKAGLAVKDIFVIFYYVHETDHFFYSLRNQVINLISSFVHRKNRFVIYLIN